MPTNDERISAAMALRLFAESDNPEILKPRVAIWIIGIHVGVKGSVTPWSLAARLAELIEPEKRTCYIEHIDEDSFHLSCGHEAAGHVSPSFCPYCGAKVVE